MPINLIITYYNFDICLDKLTKRKGNLETVKSFKKTSIPDIPPPHSEDISMSMSIQSSAEKYKQMGISVACFEDND